MSLQLRMEEYLDMFSFELSEARHEGDSRRESHPKGYRFIRWVGGGFPLVPSSDKLELKWPPS